MKATSPHEILQTNYLNFDAYIVAKCDPWQRDHILMLDMHFLSEFPKVALNSSRNNSKLLSKGDWCFNKCANQARAMLDNKVPMNPIGVGPIGYWWGWSQMTKRTWLTKPRNFKCVPSNLLDRLICDSFGWGCVVEMHPKEIEAWLVCKWVTNFQSAWFSYSRFLPWM
jgi:hypothetical protein